MQKSYADCAIHIVCIFGLTEEVFSQTPVVRHFKQTFRMKLQIKKWTLRLTVTGLFIAGLLLVIILNPILINYKFFNKDIFFNSPTNLFIQLGKNKKLNVSFTIASFFTIMSTYIVFCRVFVCIITIRFTAFFTFTFDTCHTVYV